MLQGSLWRIITRMSLCSTCVDLSIDFENIETIEFDLNIVQWFSAMKSQVTKESSS